MKCMKKWNLAVGLAAALLFAAPLAPAESEAIEVKAAEAETELLAEGTCGENLTWTLDGEGVLTISGTGEMDDYDYYSFSEKGMAPWLSYGKQIEKAVVQEGVTSIGTYAFYRCWGLKEAELAEGVTVIRQNAFRETENLVKVSIPESVTSIEENVFHSCYSLTDAALPSGLTGISDRLFYECKSLKDLSIPEGVTEIGAEAFWECRSVKAVTIPESVVSIGSSAFSCCYGMEVLVISEGVTAIEGGAFSYCNSLTTVDIPESVVSIGGSAFGDCAKLTSVNMGNHVETLGNGAFGWCENLQEVTLSEKIEKIEPNTFAGCKKLEEICIPKNVIAIKEDAFRDCNGLTEIVIPENVTKIEGNAFYGCDSLTKLIFECVEVPLLVFGDYPSIPAKVLEEVFVPLEAYEEYAKAFARYLQDEESEEYFDLAGIDTDGTINCFGNHVVENGYCTRCKEKYVPSFQDVTEADYFKDAVMWAVEEGITMGETMKRFGSYHSCTRADVVTFLYRAMGSPELENAENQFADVAEADYFYNAVVWAVENGITTGMTETQFQPYGLCTREQIVTLLWRAAEAPEVTAEMTEVFEDVTEADYFYNAVVWAVENGITTGKTESLFGVYEPCYRADCVVFLHRLLSDN